MTSKITRRTAIAGAAAWPLLPSSHGSIVYVPEPERWFGIDTRLRDLAVYGVCVTTDAGKRIDPLTVYSDS